MYREYIHYKPYQLLKLAEENPYDFYLLKKIANELQQRKDDFSFEVLLKLGKLLEDAQQLENDSKREERAYKRDTLMRRELEGIFDWPSTDAPASEYGFIGDIYFYKDGLLDYVGYNVGVTNGKPEVIRHKLLDCVFHNELPNVNNPEYMEEWAEPESPRRLQKLAETIAALTRNAKRKIEYDYSVAIREWEEDLDYLYNEYYLGYFHFGWPRP
jgi:hypothetical protein